MAGRRSGVGDVVFDATICRVRAHLGAFELRLARREPDLEAVAGGYVEAWWVWIAGNLVADRFRLSRVCQEASR